MATLTSETVENICQMISDLRGESSTNTDASRIRAISRSERDFAKRMFWRTHHLKDQTTTGSGVNSYTVGSSTFPMRMKGLSEVFVDGTSEEDRRQIVDFNAFKSLYNTNNSVKVAYEWYDAINDLWKMYINPAPAASVTITYSYFWEPPKRTLTTEVVVCPNMRIIALLALGDIYEGEDEGDLAVEKRQEAEQLIGEIKGMEEAPAVNQTYSFGLNQNVQNRGIGSY